MPLVKDLEYMHIKLNAHSIKRNNPELKLVLTVSNFELFWCACRSVNPENTLLVIQEFEFRGRIHGPYITIQSAE